MKTYEVKITILVSSDAASKTELRTAIAETLTGASLHTRYLRKIGVITHARVEPATELQPMTVEVKP